MTIAGLQPKYWTGVGSRNTPPEYMEVMTRIARYLHDLGWILRSGAADGADRAFEAGAITREGRDLWIPWKGFNGCHEGRLPIPEAFEIARSIHPAYDRLSLAGKKLHARNCHQVLGANLDDPSTFLICWTEGGLPKGGTATAIKLAQLSDVPILNLGKVPIEKAWDAFLTLMVYYEG